MSSQECAPGSLNNYNFIELFKISDTSELCLNEARVVFKAEYSSSIFVFGGDRELEEASPFIFINNTNIIFQTLNKFGDLVRHIRFRFAHLPQGEHVLGYVSDKCAKTLEILELQDCSGTDLNGLRATFDNITELKFENSILFDLAISADTSNNLSKFFPILRILRLGKYVVYLK